MNARALAEDAASWYLEALDHHSPHERNVLDILSTPVMAITRKILLSDEEGEAIATVGKDAVEGETVRVSLPNGDGFERGTTEGKSSWREHLARTNSDGKVGNRLQESQGDDGDFRVRNSCCEEAKLSRRTLARLNAFLAGCVLALPNYPLLSDVTSRSGSGGLSPKSSPQSSPTLNPSAPPVIVEPINKKDAAGEAISLSTALSGFSISGLPTKPSRNNHTSKQVGASTIPKNKTSNLFRQMSSATSPSKLPRYKKRYPQFETNDLTTRLELYTRSLRRVRSSLTGTIERSGTELLFDEECVVYLEPPRAVKARVNGVIRSFVATVGCVRSIAPALTRQVSCLTRELLAVDVLGEELQVAIRRLALEYEHMTSFASLTFLSTPEESAASQLTPLLMRYIDYLQTDWKRLISSCELERMLSRALNPAMRNTFKTMKFRSIGHLLQICREQKECLEHIAMPRAGDDGNNVEIQCCDAKAVKQALRDLRRETITVNGHILPPAHSLKELVRLLRETLNSKTLTLREGKRSRKQTCLSVGVCRSKGCSSIEDPNMDSCSVVTTAASSLTSAEYDTTDSSDNDTLASDLDFVSSGNEDDTDGGCKSKSRSKVDNIEAVRSFVFCSQAGRRCKRPSFNLNAVDVMTRRLLIAASRTGIGGDAFFVVRDIFGGKDVDVVPARYQHTYTTSGQPMLGRLPGGTIELVVRLASVTIKCHSTFEVYPKPLTNDCEPLIQLNTTTTETIYLQQVRVNCFANGVNHNGGPTVVMLKEKTTKTTGCRTLSIRPAQYKKVENYRTPS